MTTILHIASSSNLATSVTREIGTATAAALKAANPGAKLIERDLVKTTLPHISPDFVSAMYTAPDAPALALSRELVGEVLASDILVVEAPMYNFNIPSVLKAWIDHIARKGLTFNYSATGVEGLLKGKKLILVMGRGGIYSEGPMKAMEHQETYLRSLFGFLGITDVETLVVEGVGMGDEKRAESLAKAKAKLASITAKKAA